MPRKMTFEERWRIAMEVYEQVMERHYGKFGPRPIPMDYDPQTGAIAPIDIGTAISDAVSRVRRRHRTTGE
jgi:hypothetical protein